MSQTVKFLLNCVVSVSYKTTMRRFILIISFIIFNIIYFTSYSHAYDSNRYFKCYGEMTEAHKRRGFHQSNRSASIKVKEAVCKAYANGEELNYEGKR
jgi:hypothetical protein